MKMIDDFTNLYPVTKTIRFKLIPVGKTEENFVNKRLLEEDEQRSLDYKRVKGFIDRYHKKFIEDTLNKINIIDQALNEYAELYFKSNKSEEEKDRMRSLESEMRVQIVSRFKSNPDFQNLFKKEMITQLLPDKLLTDKEELEVTSSFNKFTTYFSGFYENRKNMYTEEEKSTAIAYRIVNENLPKFLDNVRVYNRIKTELGKDAINSVNNSLLMDSPFVVDDFFSVDFFNYVLSETGIERYNDLLGGFSEESGEKIQGLNELINLYNQKISKEDKSKRLPKLKPLFKQILSDRDSISYIPEQFKDDNEVLNTIVSFYVGCDNKESIVEVSRKVSIIFGQFSSYDMTRVYYDSRRISELSANMLGPESWGIIRSAWNEKYDSLLTAKELSSKKHEENRNKAFKRIESFSINELSILSDCNVVDYYSNLISDDIQSIYSAYENMASKIAIPYNNPKKLSANADDVQLIKSFLDSIKKLENDLRPILGTGKEDDKDEVFYGDFMPLFDCLHSIDILYNRVRNYITQKPYSTDKIKLNFQNPQLLGGWDNNKIPAYRSAILRKGDDYYLAIIDKSCSKALSDLPICNSNEPVYELMNYKLLSGPHKMLPKVFFAKRNLELFNPSSHILSINSSGSFKKGKSFNKSDCRDLIEFFQKSISIHKDWSQFGFRFRNPDEYSDISEFYREISNQGYMMKFDLVPVSYIDSLIDEGKLFVFRIYNKDFSKESKRSSEERTPNLHTLYFKMLFDEQNLNNVVYKLNGQAEMFYRKSSINESEMIIHRANEKIKNKNINNPKKESQFGYDLIKDKRYTKPQFMLHLPITMNFKASGNGLINEDVRKAIKSGKCKHIIGIDRGERNLLYVSVIDKYGKIVHQESLNIICNQDTDYKVDYHELLDRKEIERKKARQSWSTVESIKNLKEGYLSQAVKKITDMVIYYDAIIVMEDLNSGFKNSRVKVEKQVYQKFEKMLIDKLNFLVDKKECISNNGGMLHAYQLTQKFESFSKMSSQNGIIFYVPAWLTSKIDPVTGFVDLLKPKYTSIEAARSFINSFNRIAYLENDDMFVFDFDYSRFPKGEVSYVSNWSIYTNGTRVRTFRNPLKNNEWDNEEIVLTDEFKKLFNDYGIDYSNESNIIDQLQELPAKFYQSFMYLLGLVLQMRNSISGSVDDDRIISPVKMSNGDFFDSSLQLEHLPDCADANGAYNIARKGLWIIKQIENSEEDKLMKIKLNISNKEWLELTQNNE